MKNGSNGSLSQLTDVETCVILRNTGDRINLTKSNALDSKRNIYNYLKAVETKRAFVFDLLYDNFSGNV